MKGEDGMDVAQDQRLATGEGKALHTQRNGLIDDWRDFCQREPLQPLIPGPGSLMAERATEIAGRAGVQPEFPQPGERNRMNRPVHGRGC
jgi:hypothetical protein